MGFTKGLDALLKPVFFAVCMLITAVAGADDTDLFSLNQPSSPPSIMLLVDTSGSMAGQENVTGFPYENVVLTQGYSGDCTGQQEYSGTVWVENLGNVPYQSFTVENAERKICILRSVLLGFLQGESAWPDNYMVGLARYGVPGAVIGVPLARLDSEDDAGNTHRSRLITAVNSLSANGSTPLLGSFLDVANYLTQGDAVSDISLDGDGSVFDGASVSGYDYVAIPELQAEQCSDPNNHLIFLTDGKSTCEKASGALTEDEIGLLCSDNASDTRSGTTLGTLVNEFVTGQASNNEYYPGCPSSALSNTADQMQTATSQAQIWSCLSSVSKKLAYPQWDGTLADTDTDTEWDTLPFDTVQSHPNPTKSVPETDTPPFVTTHVIAYDMTSASASTTKGLASWPSGELVSANNADELRDAFAVIERSAILPGTFVLSSGGVGVNQLNRFTHMDEMYFSTFTPSSKPFWYGNLKKYYFNINRDDQLGIFADPQKTTVAIEDGAFLPEVLSPWSVVDEAYYNTDEAISADGDIAHIGGAASKIAQPDARKLFVSYNNVQYQITPGNTDATNLQTALSTTYSSLLDGTVEENTAALGSYQTSTLAPMLSWLMGEDVNDEWIRISQPEDPPGALTDQRPADRYDLRNFYGAPLHSSPVVVNYVSKTTDGENNVVDLDPPIDVVFVSTNDGKLYAVDTSDGTELLAYMPEAVLKRDSLTEPSPVEKMYEATKPGAEDGGLIYGLDSTWTVWRQDVNGNGNIDESSLDFVYLYGGMRRGGNNYYILDATNAYASRTISELAVLEGGTGKFADMGQTWSEPQLAIIRYNGTAAAVFIVGGGYDTVYDSGRPNTLPAKGAQVYIIAARAFTDANANSYSAGDVLWWASSATVNNDTTHKQLSALQYSIPSSVKLVELDGDGYLDHFYVGDMGGQIHRFDLNYANSGATDLISNVGTDETVVARLGVSAVAGNAITDSIDRRFFYPPSVAKMRCPQGFCMGIAIGSGWRSNPLDTSVAEKVYFLMDYEPFDGNLNRTILTDLSTYTDDGGNSITEIAPVTKQTNADQLAASSASNAVRGFSLALGGSGYSAEKMLGSPLIISGTTLFSTYYRPDNNGQDQCVMQEGAAAVYSFNPANSQALVLASGLNQNVAGSIQALISEIPSEQVIGEGGETETLPPEVRSGLMSGTGAVGPTPLELDVIRRTRWYQMD